MISFQSLPVLISDVSPVFVLLWVSVFKPGIVQLLYKAVGKFYSRSLTGSFKAEFMCMYDRFIHIGCLKPPNLCVLTLMFTDPYSVPSAVFFSPPFRYIPPDKREENDQSTHKWMVYVRGSRREPSIDHFVKKVWFFLHPSYKPNDLVEVRLVFSIRFYFSRLISHAHVF